MAPLAIRTVIDGAERTREQVLAWEAARIPRSARRIGLPVPTGDVEHQRETFADAKLALGPSEIRRRLDGALRVSDAVSRASAALARGHRVASICDLNVSGGNAADYVAWFNDPKRHDYERSMLVANPDHFLIVSAPDGRQEVIETTGGSPLPSRFTVDYGDRTSLITPSDPRFATEASGVAYSSAGTAIGGVRHQFRDTDDGFHAHLVVEFPSTVLPMMVREHRWHLAVEFGNWIHAAFS